MLLSNGDNDVFIHLFFSQYINIYLLWFPLKQQVSLPGLLPLCQGRKITKTSSSGNSLHMNEQH